MATPRLGDRDPDLSADDRASDLLARMTRAEKVAQLSVTLCAGTRPGSTRLVPGAIVELAPNRSLPVYRLSTSADAALKVLWPEMYSANGGVTTLAAW